MTTSNALAIWFNLAEALGLDLTPIGYRGLAYANVGDSIDRHRTTVTNPHVAIDTQRLLINGTGDEDPLI